MNEFLIALLENVILLMVMLPLAGSCSVVCVSGFGIATVRRTALICTLTNVFLSTIMLVRYDPDPVRVETGRPDVFQQMASSVPWLTLPTNLQPAASVKSLDIRVSLGVDGINLWLIVLTTWLMVAAVLLGRNDDYRLPVALYALLLLLESTIIGAFAAQDVMFFLIGSETTWLLLLLMIGGWGGLPCRDGVRTGFIMQTSAGLIGLVGMVSLVLVVSQTFDSASTAGGWLSFSWSELLHQVRSARNLSDVAGPHGIAITIYGWSFLCFLTAIALRMPLIPTHTWLTRGLASAPSFVMVLILGCGLNLGACGLLRFVLPLYPDQCVFVRPAAIVWGLVTMCYGALAVTRRRDAKSLLCNLAVFQAGLCLAGVFALSTRGAIGVVLLGLGQGLSAAVVLLLHDANLQEGHERCEANDRASKQLPANSPPLPFAQAKGGKRGAGAEARPNVLRHSTVDRPVHNLRWDMKPVLLRFVVVPAAAVLLAGFPGSGGFVGRWYSIWAVYRQNSEMAVVALAAAIVASAAVFYWSWRTSLSAFGKVSNSGVHFAARSSTKSNTRANVHPGTADGSATAFGVGRATVLVMLLILSGWVGINPQVVVSRTEPTLRAILQPNHAAESEDPRRISDKAVRIGVEGFSPDLLSDGGVHVRE